jgi:two-component system sensor histidine kinase RegB
MAEYASDAYWHPGALEPPGRINLRTLVYIRWVAIAGQLATLLAVHYGLGFELPLAETGAVVAASALLNIAVTLRWPLSMRLGDRAAALHFAYDVVQLSALLFLTGGLHNPFSLLILAPVTVSATALSRGSTVALGALSTLCITLLAFWHLPFPWAGAPLQLDGLYITGIWEATVIGTLFIAVYVGSVSEQARRMSDALAAAQTALSSEQRLSELGALAAAAAHELGSPLATIAVTAKEMSHEVGKDGPLAADIALLISQSDRCRDILAELAQRPEADGGPPYSRLPLSALVFLAAQPHEAAGVDLHFEPGPLAATPESQEPMARRSSEIIHGLGNLIQNAVQFANSKVTVETRWGPGELSVAVRDDGPGFAPGLLDRLGEPYLSSREGDGYMGLGVFIAVTLLKRTGGTVRFANRADGGAEAVVSWPRAALEDTD